MTNEEISSAINVMNERFHKDSVISIATCIDNIPFVRNVDGFYIDGAFYVITNESSRKMKQIKENPTVAICGNWFTGSAVAENLGSLISKENNKLRLVLKEAFKNWYDDGDINEQDPKNIILKLKLIDGRLGYEGKTHKIMFNEIYK